MTAAVAFVPVRAARACTGTVPACKPCFAPTCTADLPQWHCDVAPAGTACNDGNVCTTADQCDGNGICGGTAVTCPGADQCNTVAACNPASGCPAPVAKVNGTVCNDNDAFTVDETCQNGACTAGVACAGATSTTCTGADRCHQNPGVCDATTQSCAYPTNVCTQTLTISKIDQNSAAFLSPGAVITTSPATATIAAAAASGTISIAPGTYTVSSALAGGAFATYHSVNGGAFVVGASVSVTGSATVTFKYVPITRLVVTAAASASACGTTSVIVTAQDALGATATTYGGTVHFTAATLAKASLPANYSFVAADAGSHTFNSLAFAASGSWAITATDTVTATLTGTSGNITVNPGPVASFAVQARTSGTTTAITSVTAGAVFDLSVTAVDACNANPVTTYAGAVAVSTSPTDAQATLPASQALVAGTRTFTGVKLGTAASRQLVVKDTPGATLTGSATVQVNPGPAAVLNLSLTSPMAACATQSLTVTVQDGFQNAPNPPYTGTLSITAADSAGVYPSPHAFTAADNNSFTFTGFALKTASTATYTVTVHDAANTLSTSKNLLITPASGVGAIGIAFTPSVTACAANDVVVTAYDSCRPGVNVQPSYTGGVKFTSSDAAASVPQDYAFVASDNGQHRFVGGATLRTAGAQSVTVTDKVTPALTARTPDVSVVSGVASALLLTGIADRTPAGADISPTVRITDNCPAGAGNTVSSYRGTVQFTSSDVDAQLPAPYTFTASDSGAHTFVKSGAGTGPLVLWTVDQEWVKAADTVNAALWGQVDLTVAPGGCRLPPNGEVTLDAEGNAPDLPPCVHYVCSQSQWFLEPWQAGRACSPPDDAVDPQCNAATYICDGAGKCVGQPVTNGIPCDDGSLCTTGETCQAGVCGSPTSTVSCALPDQCHLQGACAPSTGVCSNPVKAAGAACDDGDACTANDQCNAGVCGGTLACVPGPAGALSGPSTNTTGTFTLSWPASSGVVSRYSLVENGTTEVYSGPSSTLSATLTNKPDATYKYQIQACNQVGCDTLGAQFQVTVLRLPGAPAAISGPSSAGPSYTLSWPAGSGTIEHYDLEETLGGGTPVLLAVPGALTEAFLTGKAVGGYSYRVRACNATGCSAYTAAFAVAVTSGLPSVNDVAGGASGAPPQELVGAVPGTASVTGGSAGYRVPIEVPPGRAGIQPELALVYSSRSGNGVAGVGFSISGAGSITRCPATVAQDGAGRAMLRDGNDKLCFNGQRLMLAPGGAAYGKVNSVYYSETDPYDRVTLKAQDMDAAGAYFEVRHRNGRISHFTQSEGDGDTWYLARVYDPQGNCMQFNYDIYATPHGLPPIGVIGQEIELTSIQYTGTGNPDLQQCDVGTRTVTFRYEPQPRADSRVTYQYGHAKLLTVRLAGIDTAVGTTAVRSYQFSYHASTATARSLLDTITLCAGGVACEGGRLPPITFNYQEPGATAPSLPFNDVPFASPFGTNDWQIVPLGDLDGDGTRDLLYHSGANRLLALSSCAGLLDVSTSSVSLTPTSLITPATTTASNIRGATDIDHDGRADMLGLQGNVFATSTIDCAGNIHSTNTQLTLPANITAANGWGAGAADYDGDGRLDLLYTDGLTGDSRIVLDRTPGDAVSSSTDLFTVRDPNAYPMAPPISDLVPTTAQDFNGDGLMDQWYDQSSPGLNSPLSVAFFATNQSPTASDPFPYHWVVQTAQSLSGVAPGDPRFFDGRFAGVGREARRWIDVNGDGLPDFWDPGNQQLWINRGGPVGSKLFVLVTYAWEGGAGPPPRLDAALTMDIDGDGMEELLVPTTRVDAAHGGQYCLIDNTDGVVINSDGEHPHFCGDEFDTAPTVGSIDYSKEDHSVFNWVAYRFTLRQTDGVYVLKATPTGLTAPVRAGTVVSISDVDGNGAPDVVYELFNSVVDKRQQIYQGIDPANLTAHVAFNGASAADLLTKVTQNILPPVPGAAGTPPTPIEAVTSSWSYRTLSENGPVTECGNSGKPFYVAHPGAQSLPGYAFFASSMPAVAFFDVSNGLDKGADPGGATNRTCYRYEDGMMNEQGRGFQGFKVIYEEQHFAPAASEAAAPGATCDASTTPCSANNLLKETDFLQVFPVTSRVQRILTRSQDGTLLSDSSFTWDIQAGPAAGTWVVNQAGSSESTFDTSGARLTQTVTVAQFDLASGEPTSRCVISSGPARLPTDVIACDVRTITDEVTPAADETGRFWIGRVDSQTVTTDFYPVTAALPVVSDATSGVYRGLPGTRPAMPSLPAPSASQKTHATVNTWNEGGTSIAAGSRRKLATQKIAADANPATAHEKLTAYEYDAYGNVSTETVQGHNVSTDATYPPTNTTPPSFVTRHDFSASGGYFEGSETNPANHVAAMTVDPATGQPHTHQPIQSMPTTTMNYDGFGRLLSSTTPGAQQIDTRVLSCNVPKCALRKEVWQAGAPTKVEYLDRLGRVIAEAVQGFDGNEIVTEVDYNARGAKIAEYPPASTGTGPGGWPGTPVLAAYPTTYSNIDALGRIGLKTVVRNPALFLGATGAANITTTYQYSVVNNLNTTTIQVATPTTASGFISMSRSYDARGKLVQTTQNTTSSPRGTITTTYIWAPEGTVTDIVDTAGNTLHADYDQYGRKTQVKDPDRGTWTYTWDGLGRVRTQTDARGIQQAYQYDSIGRMERRFMLPAGAGTWLLEGNWVYDTPVVGALGAMFGVVDTKLGSLTDLTKDSFQKQFTYDDHLRPLTVQTHIPAGTGYAARDLEMEYAYDKNHDRMKAMLFPGGEMVAYSYNGLGMPTVETQLLPDGTFGTAYRTVNTMSARGQISSQTFGNGVVESSDYDVSTGMALNISASGLTEHPTGCATVAAPVVRGLSYAYDQFLNLAQQQKTLYQRDANHAILSSGSCGAPLSETVSETYQYDELQRLRAASRSWSAGITVSAPTRTSGSYTYDDLGNITSKSDYADTYLYEHAPHQVSRVLVGGATKASFLYDANGNMTSGDGRVIDYDNFDRPVTVTMNGAIVTFRYAPDSSRYQQTTTSSAGALVGNEFYFDKMYEQVEDGSSIEGRSHVSEAVEVVQKTSRAVRYRHLDRLGSLEAATTEAGAEDAAYEHGYDAFGDPRSRDWQSPTDQMGQTDERGFTGHEHLDNLRLIHMNGRVYDYKLGRFLSVDPMISKPADSQSINPYSYIGNNPLSGVDPSGYCSVVTGGRMCGAQRDDVDATIYGSAPPEGGKAAADRAPPPVQSNGTPIFAGGFLLMAAHTSPVMKALSDAGSSPSVAAPNVNNVDAHSGGARDDNHSGSSMFAQSQPQSGQNNSQAATGGAEARHSGGSGHDDHHSSKRRLGGDQNRATPLA